jgi:hypothetical protein
VALFEHLGVATEESEMSFAVSLMAAASNMPVPTADTWRSGAMSCARRFLRMTRDILRFNRLAPDIALCAPRISTSPSATSSPALHSAMNFATAIWCRWHRASGRRRSSACLTIRRRPSHASSTITAC